MSVEAFKDFGLYSIAIFVAVTAYISHKWHADNALTLSKHIALDKRPYLLFAITSVVGQSFFWLFVVFWFVPHYHLSMVLAAIITIGSIGQLTAAWVPDTGKGLSSIIHYIAAFTMALTMYIFTLWMSVSPAISGFPKIFSMISFLVMTLFWCMFFISKKSREKIFIYQYIYLLLFWATVLVTAYIG